MIIIKQASKIKKNKQVKKTLKIINYSLNKKKIRKIVKLWQGNKKKFPHSRQKETLNKFFFKINKNETKNYLIKFNKTKNVKKKLWFIYLFIVNYLGSVQHK